jgi:hypothetical protein
MVHNRSGEFRDRLRANGDIVEVTHKRISFATNKLEAEKCESNDRDRPNCAAETFI